MFYITMNNIFFQKALKKIKVETKKIHTHNVGVKMFLHCKSYWILNYFVIENWKKSKLKIEIQFWYCWKALKE